MAEVKSLILVLFLKSYRSAVNYYKSNAVDSGLLQGSQHDQGQRRQEESQEHEEEAGLRE